MEIHSSIHSPISRRGILKGAAALAGAVAASAIVPELTGATTGRPVSTVAAGKSPIAASDSNAIVEITAGKVRGYTRNGIYTFKGIPYAASTAGSARFMPPVKVTPWAGVRSSMQFGNVSPQGPRAGWANDEEAWMFSWDDGIPGEDCLRVNIWTPGINDHKKRPVMVWLHGGGFQSGSGQELKSYDGENLARRGDAVLVSLNHRLGVLGYMDLSAYGDRYTSSGNVGMLDIVAALEWVRDNIGNFGGDPANVTIFGQSGGGGKVGTLMAMPGAQGLFHKAIVQSGSMLRAGTHEKSQRMAAAVLDQLGLSPAQADELQSVPYQKLIEAGVAAVRKLVPAGLPDMRRIAERLGWTPIVDERILPQHPFDPEAPAISANVPMLIGTVLNEFMTALNHPEHESMSNEEVNKRVGDMYGEKSAAVIAAFRRAHPEARPFDIYSLIAAAPVRQNAVRQAERKAALNAAPAYLWWFTWKTPVLDGRPRAFHCAELAFAFDNTDRCENMTGGGPEPRALAARMSQAWIEFARKGDPNHPGLPAWPTFSAGKCPTMIFDKICVMKDNPDLEERKVIQD
jgi:para-nitrobenzyl esterase